MVRGTGKFKQKRGGGRSFSKHLVLDENGTAVASERTDKWARRGRDEDNEDEDDDSNEEEDEEEDEEEEEEESGEEEQQPEMTRAERKAMKKKVAAEKAGKSTTGDDEEEDEDLINPNHVKKKVNISDMNTTRELSRREREQKEKQEAKDRYWKLHLAGKTDEAKADLSRLAKIRAEREAAQAKRKAEAEAKAAEIAAKTEAQRAAQAKKAAGSSES